MSLMAQKYYYVVPALTRCHHPFFGNSIPRFRQRLRIAKVQALLAKSKFQSEMRIVATLESTFDHL
ncbi:hypothetical protein DDZ13_11000 [Coraliomargarita sinensis]|uniref:Uncharacterized protein n=1 Tax=Coraliomargarita sinensis TaxID=2174842 RepID=A0A317ZDU8_9BACT|nr:hypothetical protein DDZ13_11000 [Coraliomargarita sinensis]